MCVCPAGLSGLAAGVAIGIVGDAGVRATAQQPKLFVGMILILIFAEVRCSLHPPSGHSHASVQRGGGRGGLAAAVAYAPCRPRRVTDKAD